MRAQRSRAGGLRTSPTTGDVPAPSAIVAVTVTVLMLMVFSIVFWKLGNNTLSAVAGTGACTLAGEAIRRYLGDHGRRRERELETPDDHQRVDR
ncbi:hypothetical protein AB0B39_06725 [Micromonospora sp. NPDC049114]|uniref:hypothetical protein n=1 Tax=Micromonospora sp. NPDC049114 TaxID=3155498 RepID=UPI0033EA4621